MLTTFLVSAVLVFFGFVAFIITVIPGRTARERLTTFGIAFVTLFTGILNFLMFFA